MKLMLIFLTLVRLYKPMHPQVHQILRNSGNIHIKFIYKKRFNYGWNSKNTYQNMGSGYEYLIYTKEGVKYGGRVNILTKFNMGFGYEYL